MLFILGKKAFRVLMFKSLFNLLLIALLTATTWVGDATANGASKVKIIGLDADMSAVAKEGGIAIMRGAQIAIDEINDSGGVLGHQLKLEVKNHRGNPARGKHNLKKFASNPDVVAVLGGVHTPVVMQELELIHQYKIPFLVPWAAGTPIIDNGFEPNFVFRISVRDAEAAEVMLKYAKSTGNKKVALLLEQTGWGRSNEKSMTKAAQQLGLEITHVAWFNWRQPSMLSELNRIRKSGATSVMVVANAPEGAVIIKEVAEQNFNDLQFVSHWGIAGGSFVDQVGINVLASVDLAVLQTYSFALPHNPSLNLRILKQYQDRFDPDTTPNSVSGAVGVAHAYDLVHVLAKAIKNANSFDRIEIQRNLEQVKEYNGLVKNYGQPFSSKQHDALLAKDYMMAKYNENGHLVPLIND